jgi:PAS domain S-box-containing protein
VKLSLSVKVSLVIITLVVAGGVLTGFLVDKSSRNALEKSISTTQLEITQQALDKTDRFLYERQSDMEIAATRLQIKTVLTNEGNSDPATLAQLTQGLQQLQTTYGAWNRVTVFDRNGNQVATTIGDSVPDAPPSQDKMLKVIFDQAMSGQTVYSDAVIAGSTQAPNMVFMAPVRSTSASAEVVGVVEGELAWPTVLEILQTVGDSTATLLNKQGQVLGNNIINTSTAPAANKAQAVLLSRQKDSNGSAVMKGIYDTNNFYVTSHSKEAGFLNFKGNGWTMVLESPRALAFGPAQKLTRTLVLTYSLILFLSVGLILWTLNKLILRPIVNLNAVIDRLSRGDFSLRTDINSHDELGDLGKGLNDMADKMQVAYSSLGESTKAAQNEKQVFETLLDNLPVGVMVVKAPSGEPILINRIAEQITGHKANSLEASKSYLDVYEVIKEDGQPYPDNERPLNIVLDTGKSSFKEDMFIRRPDGSTIAVRTIAAPIEDINGQLQMAVSVFEDITEKNALERSREEFFSIASHELRTPLTAIMGNSSLIDQYYGDKLPDDNVREMLSDIHESSLRLIDIVNDFLDTSRLEQKHMKYELTDFDVVDMAESIVKEYQVTGSRKKIHLEVLQPSSPLALVKADQNRAKQVLINLVGNAMKFTENGSVTVSFLPEGKFIKVLIKDTGRGMTFEAQQLLFRKFEQTGATVLTRDSVRGTGLGLYISKLIMEQMGGTVTLESSAPGVGTTFSFSLPITPTV